MARFELHHSRTAYGLLCHVHTTSNRPLLDDDAAAAAATLIADEKQCHLYF